MTVPKQPMPGWSDEAVKCLRLWVDFIDFGDFGVPHSGQPVTIVENHGNSALILPSTSGTVLGGLVIRTIVEKKLFVGTYSDEMLDETPDLTLEAGSSITTYIGLLDLLPNLPRGRHQVTLTWQPFLTPRAAALGVPTVSWDMGLHVLQQCW